MARVVRPGGAVVTCAWDFEHDPVQVFWRAAEQLDPGATAAIDLVGSREGQLAELMTDAGLHDVRSTTLTVRVEIATFEEWWAPFAYRVGPAGEYFAALPPAHQEALRVRCAELLPGEPVVITGVARAAVSRRA
jgi:hypothetical protein